MSIVRFFQPQFVFIQALKEIYFLIGRDPEAAGQPKLIDPAGDIFVTILQLLNPLLHQFSADCPGEFLITGYARGVKRLA